MYLEDFVLYFNVLYFDVYFDEELSDTLNKLRGMANAIIWWITKQDSQKFQGVDHEFKPQDKF